MISPYINGWKKSFDYSGRSTRSDFWLFVLVDFIIYLPLYAGTLYLTFNAPDGPGLPAVSSLLTIYGFAGIFPRISLAVRRMNDIGKRWIWVLTLLVPCIGPFWFIYLAIQPSVGG